MNREKVLQGRKSSTVPAADMKAIDDSLRNVGQLFLFEMWDWKREKEIYTN